MTGAINSLKAGSVKDWYLETSHRASTFINRVGQFRAEGYELNIKNGLLFRAVVSPEAQEKIDHTLVDIVFLRPVDMHRHIDVTEYIKVLSGEGLIFTGKKGMRARNRIDPSQWSSKEVKEGDHITIPRYLPHCFAPADHNYDHLELRLACSGILKDECERQIKPFYEWPKELIND